MIIYYDSTMFLKGGEEVHEHLSKISWIRFNN